MTNAPTLRIQFNDVNRKIIYDIDPVTVLEMRHRYPYSLDVTGYINDQPVHIERLYDCQDYRDADARPGQDLHRHDCALLFVPTNIPPRTHPDLATLADLAAAAGYYRHLDLDRLLTDVRRHPGCSAVTGPTLANYMHGRTRTPRHVAEALAVVLGVSLEVIVRGAK